MLPDVDFLALRMSVLSFAKKSFNSFFKFTGKFPDKIACCEIDPTFPVRSQTLKAQVPEWGHLVATGMDTSWRLQRCVKLKDSNILLPIDKQLAVMINAVLVGEFALRLSNSAERTKNAPGPRI